MHELAKRIAKKFTQDGNEYAKLVNIAHEEILKWLEEQAAIIKKLLW